MIGASLYTISVLASMEIYAFTWMSTTVHHLVACMESGHVDAAASNDHDAHLYADQLHSPQLKPPPLRLRLHRRCRRLRCHRGCHRPQRHLLCLPPRLHQRAPCRFRQHHRQHQLLALSARAHSSPLRRRRRLLPHQPLRRVLPAFPAPVFLRLSPAALRALLPH